MNGIKKIVATVLTTGLISSSMALGQTPPMPPAPPAQQQAGPGAPPTVVQQGYSGNQDYPAAEVQAVPAARARAFQARWQQYQAQDDLYRTVGRLREDFNYSPDYLRASADEAVAYSEYISSRQAALQELRKDPNYRAQLDIASRLKEQLDSERSTPKAQFASLEMDEQTQHRLAMSLERLVHTSTASAMEAAVLATDEKVQASRKKLLEAGQRTAIMREIFERKIRRDDQFLFARRNFEDARIQRIAAGEFYEGTLDARDIALNFAYYIHRYDQIRNQFVYPTYGYGGYGGAYGYGATPVGYSGVGYNYGYRYR
jgi:hypothetical protein